MDQEQFCQDCHQKHECQEVYRRLGGSECPSVFYKVIAAFLLPMLVFTVCLAIFEHILKQALFGNISQDWQTTIGFFMALLVTVVFILVMKLLQKLIRNSSKNF